MTRDTDFERIRREHALLIESIEVTPIPFAVYDDQDRLIAWNATYERVHRRAFAELRGLADRHALHYADLVRAEARATLPAAEVEAHVAARVALHRGADGRTIDREYPDARWYRISKFRTRSGAVAGFGIDITELKQRESRLEEEIRRRMELEEMLRDQMNTDALTRVSSRVAFLARAGDDFQRARAAGQDVAVIMMDIDRFKNVNDDHGHSTGDDVLARVARTATEGLRQDRDLIGRLGGEEFAILLLDAGGRHARSCAEHIRAAIEALCFPGADGPFGVTASFGIAQRDDGDADLSALISRADEALYIAKRSGRNQVVTAAD